MKRGEIWTQASGADYSGKPRPAVIIQADRFDATGSITLCGFTSIDIEAPLFRILVEPSETNGLNGRSFVMVDKIVTVPREKLGRFVGTLSDHDLAKITRALVVFLGIAE